MKLYTMDELMLRLGALRIKHGGNMTVEIDVAGLGRWGLNGVNMDLPEVPYHGGEPVLTLRAENRHES